MNISDILEIKKYCSTFMEEDFLGNLQHLDFQEFKKFPCFKNLKIQREMHKLKDLSETNNFIVFSVQPRGSMQTCPFR